MLDTCRLTFLLASFAGPLGTGASEVLYSISGLEESSRHVLKCRYRHPDPAVDAALGWSPATSTRTFSDVEVSQ
jgi:hypothetical protein